MGNQLSPIDGRVSSFFSGYLLDGFSKIQRDAIRTEMEKTPIEQFHTITDKHWLKYRGCGRKFLMLLKHRGLSKQTPDIGISVRAQNVLRDAGIEPTKEDIEIAIKSGKLSLHGKNKPRQYGLTTHNELLQLVGLATQKRKKMEWKFDPYTGDPLLG